MKPSVGLSKAAKARIEKAAVKAVEKWMEEPWPAWAEKMAVAVYQSMFATLDFTDEKQSPIGAAGAYLGHMAAFAGHVASGGKNYVCITRSVAELVKPGQLDPLYQKLAMEILNSLKDTLHDMAQELKPSEAEEFHRRFKAGFEAGCLDDEGLPKKFPPNGRLYHVMSTRWQYVESLKNRAELYRWVCLELGEAHAPNREAFVQICKRFGVRLAKPGHPRK